MQQSYYLITLNPPLYLDIPELTLRVLDKELKTLTKPIQFGIKLGIPQYRIEIIQQDHCYGEMHMF